MCLNSDTKAACGSISAIQDIFSAYRPTVKYLWYKDFLVNYPTNYCTTVGLKLLFLLRIITINMFLSQLNILYLQFSSSQKAVLYFSLDLNCSSQPLFITTEHRYFVVASKCVTDFIFHKLVSQSWFKNGVKVSA